MNSRKPAARALTLFPAVVLLVAAVVQIRARLELVRADTQPKAITYLVERQVTRHTPPPSRLRPPHAQL